MSVLSKVWRYLVSSVVVSEPVISYADFADRAADLIESTGWNRGWYARDSKGNNVNFDSPSAASYCVRGAVYRNYRRFKPSIAWKDMVAWQDAFSQYLENVPEFQTLLSKKKATLSTMVFWNDYVAILDKELVVRTLRNFAEEQRNLEEPKYLTQVPYI